MKIRAFLPALIALLILLGLPYTPLMRVVVSKHHGGLVCYCCTNAAKPCVMISCSCCKDKTGIDIPRWVPEMIFNSHHPVVSIKLVYTETEFSITPGKVYIEVPVQPPNAIQSRITFI